jgi:monovalent cation/hydrogen antiporter
VRIPYPVLLVLGGLAIGLVPAMPEFELEPELSFFGVLPPLLYSEPSSPRFVTCVRTFGRSACWRSNLSV